MRDPELVGRHEIFDEGNILVSIRHQNCVAVFDWSTKELLWTWGRGELLGPHDAQVLPSGNLLIFDNGLGRKWSRVIELDPTTEEIVWEYRASPKEDFYTASRGSNQRLANGNTLIAESDEGRMFEVTREGREVWRYVVPERGPTGGRAVVIRAVRYSEGFVPQ